MLFFIEPYLLSVRPSGSDYRSRVPVRDDCPEFSIPLSSDEFDIFVVV